MMDDRRGFVCMCKTDSLCIILSDTLHAGRKQGMTMDGEKRLTACMLSHTQTHK